MINKKNPQTGSYHLTQFAIWTVWRNYNQFYIILIITELISINKSCTYSVYQLIKKNFFLNPFHLLFPSINSWTTSMRLRLPGFFRINMKNHTIVLMLLCHSIGKVFFNATKGLKTSFCSCCSDWYSVKYQNEFVNF